MKHFSIVDDDDDDDDALGTNSHTTVSDDVKTGSLTRSLSGMDGFCIVVGIMIGSGIFSSPGVALSRADGSPLVTLLAWLLSGVLVIITSQCYFELNGMIPSAAGDYAYILRAYPYGEYISFSFAFFNFFVSKPGSQAIIATVFGKYMSSAIYMCFYQSSSISSEADKINLIYVEKISAVILVTALAIINMIGLKQSTLLQNLLTMLKMVLVAGLLLASFAYAGMHPQQMYYNLSTDSNYSASYDSSFAHHHNFSQHIQSFGKSLVACLWAFDGWADLNYMNEEMIDPNQMPAIVTCAVVIVTWIYLLANIAYFSVLPIYSIETSEAVAVELASVVSNYSSIFIPLLFALGVAISAISSNNGSIMSGGRAFFGAARDLKWNFFAGLNKVGVPANALAVQCIWSIVLLLAPGSSFTTLLDYFGPCSWFFYAITSFATVLLRAKEPDLYRPYKMMLYPLPPLLVAIMAITIITSSIMTSSYTVFAFLIILVSIPIKYLLLLCEGRNNGSGSGKDNDGMHIDDDAIFNVLDIDDDDSYDDTSTF